MIPRMFSRVSLIGVLVAAFSGAAFTTSQSTAPAAAGPPGGGQHSRPPGGGQQEDNLAQLATIKQYCAGCHNDRDRRPVASASTDSRRTRSGSARTCSKRRCASCAAASCRRPALDSPTQPAVDSLVGWLEDSLDRAAAAGPSHLPDQVVLHRLNRKEYANAVRDLLAVDIDAAELLPADDVAEGFDNIATALQVSPSFIEQYVIAARAVAVKALGKAGCATGRLDVPRGTGHPAHVTSRAFRSARAAASSRKSISRRMANTSSTSPTWPPTSGATAWSSRTRSSSPSTTSWSTRR